MYEAFKVHSTPSSVVVGQQVPDDVLSCRPVTMLTFFDDDFDVDNPDNDNCLSRVVQVS